MAAEKADLVGDVSFRRSQSDKKNTNKQKCLLVGSRSMSTKARHLLVDLAGLMPHARPHAKIDAKQDAGDTLTELAGLHRCNTTFFIEGRKRETAFVWIGQSPNGPSAKLQLFNVHTSSELRMAGNCLKFSRPLLHFDAEFDSIPHLRIVKALFTDIFNTPQYHPRSKPFVDHMVCLFYLDGKIWFRHYQMLTEQEAQTATGGIDVMEIGPRFVMDPVVVLNGNMQGSVLWKSGSAVAPTEIRKGKVQRSLDKMRENARIEAQGKKHRETNPAPGPDPFGHVFKTNVDDYEE